MADIAITDNVGATEDIKTGDDSQFALSGLSHLTFTDFPVVSDLAKPINTTTLQTAKLGVTLKSPSILIASPAALTIKGGETGNLVIRKPADKKLFEDEDFSLAIPIGPDECWIGLTLDTLLDGKLSATVDGFGIAVEAAQSVSFGRYILLQRSAGQFPTLTEGLKSVLESYSVAYTVDQIRRLRPGTVNIVEMSGTVKFSGSYSPPITVNALASATLPFNNTIKLNPAQPLKITGEIALTGDFIVRSYKITDSQLHLGVYKKRGTTFTATLTAKAGVEADIGTTDVVSAVFGAVLPGVDPAKSGLTGDGAEAIRGILKDCLDRSLSIGMNVSCSAAFTDEAAVVYSIDLNAGSSVATNAAISSALRGDWTLVDALPNAKPLRNIAKETHESKYKIGINLLGFYNAGSVDDYVKSCTILRDDNGFTITDKARASHIAAADKPYAADPDKLRKALAEGFVTTMTYTAVASQAGLTASQTYFRYADNMPQADMQEQIRLGRALKLIRDNHWDDILAATPSLRHVKVTAGATYDAAGALRLFFSDASGRTPRTHPELERIGREAMISLIDSTRPQGKIRIDTLRNDALWSEMDKNGNIGAFQKMIPALGRLNIADFQAVSGDWADITWWADSMVQVAAKLRDLLATIDPSTAPDPTDPNFKKKRKALEDKLLDVAQHARAAFADGWGLAVMSAISEGAGAVNMEIAWNSSGKEQYSLPARLGAAT